MSVRLYTASDQPLRLGPKLGTGGEGTVYAVEGAPDLVVKLYHESITEERAAKLEWLARNGSERLLKLTAWPVDVVREQPGGRVAGFTMKRIGQAEEVHALHSPKSRLQKFPEASWAFLLYVAANIARAVTAVHEHGLVVGDLNPKNILVTRQATVHLLDCDSFQVRVADTVYRCEAGFPDYTPPELQGVAFRDVDRSAAHDAFGLGVVIFQLLFLGRHPFSGKFTGGEEMPLERAIREGRFAYGSDAGQRAMQPPPGTLALEAVSEPVMKLFRRAFLYVPDDRPQPREWVTALDTLAQALKRCDSHDGHQFYEGLAACPWCEIETRARVRLFNFALTGKQQAQGYFRLADVWREIESVVPPRVPVIPNRMLLMNVTPSPEAEELAQEKQKRFRKALLTAVPVGLGTAWLLNLPGAIWPLLVMASLIRQFLNPEQAQTGFRHGLLQSNPTPANNPALEPFVQRQQQLEAAYNELDARWQQEASESRFLAKFQELETGKLGYANLASARAQRLAQLEAQARTDQRQIFLRQHPLQAQAIKGIGENLAATLHAHGIQTAAEIEVTRLKAVPGIGEARAQVLLNWRREIEQQFVFDAQRAIPPQRRLQLEQEFDALRMRLEQDLSSGAAHLRRFQQEIKGSQEVLYEPLLKAQRNLAQAELDLEVAQRKKPAWLVIIVLVLSFLVGSWIEDYVKGYKQYSPALHEPRKSVDLPPPPPPPKPLADVKDEAIRFYNAGTTLLNDQRFNEAVEKYQQALALDSGLAGAYQELGEAYYRLGHHEKSIEASLNALRITKGFPAYVTLGQAHMALQHWEEARAAFDLALSADSTILWQAKHWETRYQRAVCIQNLGRAQREIATVQAQLQAGRKMADGVTEIEKITSAAQPFDLAALHWLTGNQGDSSRYLAILKSLDARAAEVLQRLLSGSGQVGNVTGDIEDMGQNGVGRPTILYREKAKYTEAARQNKVEGVVVLQVVFTADGRLTNIHVQRGLPDGLTEKAIEAAQKIRFSPATKDGTPVSVRGTLEFTFKLY